MNSQRFRIPAICVTVLFIASVCQVFFAHWWFKTFVQGRLFPVTGGVLLPDLIRSLPFVLPFSAGGFLLARSCASFTRGLLTSAALGLIGGLLFWQLVQVYPASAAESIFERLDLYVRYLHPLLFSVLGYFSARLFHVEPNV